MKKLLSSVLVSIFMFTMVQAGEEYTTKTPLEAANFLGVKGIIEDHTNNPTEYRLLDTITRKEVMKIVMRLSSLEIRDICN